MKGWLDNQRADYRQGTMKPQRLQMFIDNGLLTILESPFEKGYRYAKAYFEEHGDLYVPHSYVCSDGFKLGAWITGVRDRIKRSKSLRKYIPMLDEIGMIWDVQQYNWMQNYNTCKAYYIEHGDLELPETLLGVNGQVLKNWLKKCRKQYDKHELTEEQEKLLKDIHAFDIVVKSKAIKVDKTENKPQKSVEKRAVKKNHKKPVKQEMSLSVTMKKWQEHCLEVKQFYDLNGHTAIPKDFMSSDGIVLRNWLHAQRTHLKQGKLSEKKIAFLNENGIYGIIAEVHKPIREKKPKPKALKAKSATEIRWENNALLLKSFYEENQHTHIPKDAVCENGASFAVWFRMQRARIRKGQFSEERFEFLKSNNILELFTSPIIFGKSYKRTRRTKPNQKRDSQWQENCMKIKVFVEEYHTRTIPDELLTSSGSSLKNWYSVQKTKFRRGELSQSRMDFLKENVLTYLFEKFKRKKQETKTIHMTLPVNYIEKLSQIVSEKALNNNAQAVKLLIDFYENH